MRGHHSISKGKKIQMDHFSKEILSKINKVNKGILNKLNLTAGALTACHPIATTPTANALTHPTGHSMSQRDLTLFTNRRKPKLEHAVC